MSGGTLSRAELENLREDLSGRDVAIVSQVADLRLMTARQIEAVHFPLGDHDPTPAAARACRRCLGRLTRDRLLVRLERRIGGVRAGSGLLRLRPRSGGSPGPRRRAQPRPRYREPTAMFVDHTLAVAQLVTDLTCAARSGLDGVAGLPARAAVLATVHLGPGASPRCGPDLFVSLGDGEFELRWFCEVDRGSEHLPALIRKCRLYESYYAHRGRTGHPRGVPPGVLAGPRRPPGRAAPHAPCATTARLTDALFIVATTNQATRAC